MVKAAFKWNSSGKMMAWFVGCILMFNNGFMPVHAAEHIVKVITDNENGVMAFSPKHMRIEKGDTVTWVNQVKDFHNVITYPDGYPKGSTGFVSPYLKEAGEKWSYTFPDVGTFQYHCIPHVLMGMRGTVVVGKETKQSDFHQPSIQEVKAYRDEILRFFDETEIEILPDVVKRNMKPIHHK